MGASFLTGNPAKAETCWWEQDTGKMMQSRCNVSMRTNSNGHNVVDITSADGFTTSLILWTNNGKPNGAEVFLAGKRFTANWWKDNQGDYRVKFFGKQMAFRF